MLIFQDLSLENSCSSSQVAPVEEQENAVAMEFVSGHFKESSEEEEDAAQSLEDRLAEGLEPPPDVDDEVEGPPSAQAQFLSAALQNSTLVTQTVSSVWGSTMTGLSHLRETVRNMSASAPTEGAGGERGAGSNYGNQTVEEATDTVAAEFEFLSQEDLEESLHEAGLGGVGEEDGGGAEKQ